MKTCITAPTQRKAQKKASQDFAEATPSAEQVLAARQMVQTLQTPYDAADWSNPALQKHFNALECYALEAKGDELKVECGGVAPLLVLTERRH